MSAIQMYLVANHVLDSKVFFKEERQVFFLSHQEGKNLFFPLMIIIHS